MLQRENRQVKRLTAMLMLVLFLAMPASGDIYTWIDTKGVKHFSNEPPSDAEKVDRQAETRHSAEQYESWDAQRKLEQDKILEGSPSGDQASPREPTTGNRRIKDPGKVVMYTTPKCGYCVRAKAFFAKHNIAYTEYDITSDDQARARYKQLKGNGVPLIFVGDKRISGFNQGLLKRLFGIK